MTLSNDFFCTFRAQVRFACLRENGFASAMRETMVDHTAASGVIFLTSNSCLPAEPRHKRSAVTWQHTQKKEIPSSFTILAISLRRTRFHSYKAACMECA